MAPYRIVTDSTTDLSPALVEKMNVTVMPLTFTMDGKTYRNTPDETDMSSKVFYDKVRAGSMPTTSQLNPMDFKEAQWVEENRLHLAHWFTVDDLNHLKRGGRVSGAAAFFGTMLSIKPVLHVDDEGHLIPMEKVRGRRQSLDALVEHMAKTGIDNAHQTIFISHGDCKDDVEYVAQQIRQRFGTADIYTNPIGPVIGAHSGPGTVALFFLAESRN